MEDYPKPVSKHCLQNILEQMNKYFYKIKGNNGKYNIGFFCHFKIKENSIPFVVIDKYLKGKEFIIDTIKILLKNKNIILDLGDKRYRNEKYNITIMEIKENNNINYMELDEKLNGKDLEMSYNKESIYIIKTNFKKEFSVSYGKIKYINKSNIIYASSIVSKVSPIFNLTNNKLIGMHLINSTYYNHGIHFNVLINELINKNEINILVKVYKDKINKKIYFLDNYEYEDKYGKKHFHDNLNELNKLNTELYINNKICDYEKYIIPDKEGKYNIKLKIPTTITDSSFMFAGCKDIINIDFTNFKSKKIKNMRNMFSGCEFLNTLDLFSFDTKNVTDMSNMFTGCEFLNNLDLFSFDTKNVTDMSSMFSGCKSLTNLDLSYFDTKNVKDMSFMFDYCKRLINLDISSFDTKNVTDMRSMFYYCESLINLDLSSFDTKNVKDMSLMFDDCKKLENLDISSFDTKNVKDMSFMFSYCNNIKNLDLSSFDTKNVNNIKGIFYKCEKILDSNSSTFKKFTYKEMTSHLIKRS